MRLVPTGRGDYNAPTMRQSRGLVVRLIGVLAIAGLATAMGRAPTAAPAAAGPTVRVHLVVCIENLDPTKHPIRVLIDGQPVFHRRVHGPSNFNLIPGQQCQRQMVRLTTGVHQVQLEEELTHVVQHTQITVAGPSELRVGFWPWYQNGQFRQEPHFSVRLIPAGGAHPS